MSEPVPILLAKIERQLGLVRPSPWSGDADCPSPEVLEWLAEFDPLYDTLPVGAVAPDTWVQVRNRMENREWRKLRAVAGRWRTAAAVLAVSTLGLGAMLWNRAAAPPRVVVVTTPQTPPVASPGPAPVGAAPLMATMRAVGSKQQDTLFVLVAAPRGAAIRSTPADVALHPGHSYRLWVEDGTRAVLVGAVSPSISHSLTLAADQRRQVQSGSRLVVTLDPDAADDQLQQKRIVARGELTSI